MKKIQGLFVSLLVFLPFALLAADKVVVIPLRSAAKNVVDGRIWGEGRINATLMTMDTTNGYCESPSGVNFAISTHLSGWNSVASVCPADTWVCGESDIGGNGCATPSLIGVTAQIDCDGTIQPSGDPQFARAWLADADPGDSYLAKMMSSDTGTVNAEAICINHYVWCCWK